MKTARDVWTFRRGDGVAIAAVLLAAAAMLAGFLLSAGSGGNAMVRIYQEGNLVQELPLATDAEVTLGGAYQNTVTIRDGRVAVTESDCPGADCVHTGWISSPGRSIVCLPNRVEIRLEGTQEEDDVDAVVW